MTYTPYQFANNAQSTVAGGAGGLGTPLSSGDTTLHLPTGHGARFPSSGYFMLQMGTTEIVKVTLRSTDDLTIIRAQEGTSASSWPVGTTVQQIVSAQSLNDGMSELAALDSAKASLSGAAFTGNISTTGTLGVTGAATLSGTAHVVGAATLDSTLTVTGAATLTGGVAAVKTATATGLGLPVLVGVAENVSVTTTALTTILTLNSPNDGNNHTYMALAWIDLNNGTPGQNIQLQIVYTDPRTGASNTTPFSTATSTASQSFNASASIGNGRYATYPYVCTAKPGTAVTIQYRDPANTPADHVTALLFQLT